MARATPFMHDKLKLMRGLQSFVVIWRDMIKGMNNTKDVIRSS